MTTTVDGLGPLPTRQEVDDHWVRCRPAQWQSRVDAEHYPSVLDDLPTHDSKPKYRKIARRDVAALASDVTPVGRIRLLVATFVWGTGSNGFLLGRNARWLKGDMEQAGARLVAATETLRQHGAGAAYSSMLRGGPSKVDYVGPAYFTKYLYFAAAGMDVPGLRPLILDRRVASALRTHTDLGTSKQGWSVAEYEAYLARAAALADQHGAAPDAVELALFRAGGSRT